MIIIRNKIIPFSGYKALCLWPFIFVRSGATFSPVDERHERIHGDQQFEMLVIGLIVAGILAVIGCSWWSLLALPMFFYWYGIEWLVRLIIYRNRFTAYKNISFEREAYVNQNDVNYLDKRKPFAWVYYLNHYF